MKRTDISLRAFRGKLPTDLKYYFTFTNVGANYIFHISINNFMLNYFLCNICILHDICVQFSQVERRFQNSFSPQSICKCNLLEIEEYSRDADSLVLFRIACLFPCDVLATKLTEYLSRDARKGDDGVSVGIDGPVKGNTDLSALMGYLSSVHPYSLSLSMFVGTG